MDWFCRCCGFVFVPDVTIWGDPNEWEVYCLSCGSNATEHIIDEPCAIYESPVAMIESMQATLRDTKFMIYETGDNDFVFPWELFKGVSGYAGKMGRR